MNRGEQAANQKGHLSAVVLLLKGQWPPMTAYYFTPKPKMKNIIIIILIVALVKLKPVTQSKQASKQLKQRKQ